MSPIAAKTIEFACIFGIVSGIRLMNSPKTARTGNLLGAACMLAAVITTMITNNVVSLSLLWISLILGAALGSWLAIYVTMTQIPQLVALLNGLGGAASAIVAFLVIANRTAPPAPIAQWTAALALVIGMVTFGGSMIAVAKLDGRITPLPIILTGHFLLNLFTLIAIVILVPLLTITAADTPIILAMLLMLISLLFGVLFAIRVGGADMPIAISLLNSLSGIAAATVGLATANLLVVAIGAIVGSAGIVLTQIMCRAMNSSILDVLMGKTVVKTPTQKNTSPAKQHCSPQTDPTTTKAENTTAALDKATAILRDAKNIIIVPGYGMALAQAQVQVKQLLDLLQENGKQVKFAIHPVAGRMPGHMNVLLAEVEIPYHMLCPMETINPEFKETDVALVVGANDVVNPAAKTAEGTPIYGMPVLSVDQARHVIMCNKDASPGYAGVDNPLYSPEKNATLLLGDAKKTLADLLLKLQDHLHNAARCT